MTTTDLVHVEQTTDVATQMQWAQAVVARKDGAAQSILPDAYRDNPANVLVAVGLGQAMGLSFAESLYRINVIKGKPSAAAELIASNVRKAGHKLRVRVTEEPPSATCTIVRADDPDEPTVITRDMAWAQRMGLTGEPNYKKQPATMLSYRAITACARLACPEALYGVAYTPDEIEDGGTLTATPAAPAQPSTPTAAAFREPAKADDVQDADEVPDEPAGPKLDQRRQRKLFQVFKAKGVPEDKQLPLIEFGLQRTVGSRTAITEAEWEKVIGYLETLPDGGLPFVAPDPRLPVWLDLLAAAGQQGVDGADLRSMLEDEYAQPVDDLTGEQLTATLAALRERSEGGEQDG